MLLADGATSGGLSAWLLRVGQDPLVWAAVLAGAALWLLLPRGRARGRRLGIVLGLVGVGLLGWMAERFAGWAEQSLFGIFAGITVIASAAAISARNPVYSAIWFGMVLLGTAALFLYQGAQFLGVATVVVYAGAILVTFLFVLMLAQPQGHAYYDRVSWEAFGSAVVGALMIGILTASLSHAMAVEASAAERSLSASGDETRDAVQPPTSGVFAREHVATLGREMFGRHLIAIEVAGAMLLAALVGAVAIVAQGHKRRKPLIPGVLEEGGGA